MNKIVLLIGALVAMGALVMPVLVQVQDAFADGQGKGQDDDKSRGHKKGDPPACDNKGKAVGNPHCPD